MSGGVIGGNTTLAVGGGVEIGANPGNNGSFTKAGGGIIYGKNEGKYSNKARMDNEGHAVCFREGTIIRHYVDTTVEENENLNYRLY
jgi:hypothetical protein